MKLFSIYTNQTLVLKDQWFLKTLQDDWELHLIYLKDAPKGDGDYLSDEWYYCIKSKIALLIEAIKNNWNAVIIWADIDIQFFRRCTDIIEQSIQNNDIVFQIWNKKKKEVNSGFMAIRCNEKTLAFFKTVLATPFKDRKYADQDIINDMLKQGSMSIRWGFFGREIYHIGLGVVPFNIVLHHACGTSAPFIKYGRKISSIELKIKQLTRLRRVKGFYLWISTSIVLKKLIKYIVHRLNWRVKKRIRYVGWNGIRVAYYKNIYAKIILKTKPMVCTDEGRFELHTLTCEKDSLNTLWSLKTFCTFSEVRPRVVIYDDGSLSEAAIDIFSEHFLNCQIIRRDRFHRDMEDFLKVHRMSLENSKMKSFYLALKLFGPMYYAKSEYILCLDSDVLFFQKPREMLKHMENGTPFYMNDYQNAYSHPIELLNSLLKINLPHRINSGLFYIAKRDFADNIGLVESYFRKVPKCYGMGWLEQTLAAILLSKANAVRLSSDYQISREPVTDETISHHFVNDGSRPDFYAVGLRRLKSAGFIKKLGDPA